MLGISYKSAWFLTMRIREAMKSAPKRDGPIGGPGKIVESDETFVGGKKKNVHKGKPEPKKHAVHALVERGAWHGLRRMSRAPLEPWGRSQCPCCNLVDGTPVLVA
jgi:hypothetical protein